MNPALQTLAETILSISCDANGISFNVNFSVSDINKSCLDKLYQEYLQFIELSEKRISEIFGDEWESIDEFYELMQPIQNQTERDFIYTRNKCGCGFWDGDWMKDVSEILEDECKKFSEIIAIYDNEKIYLYL